MTMAEALALWALCVSVIQAMVAEMEKTRVDSDPMIATMAAPAATDPEDAHAKL